MRSKFLTTILCPLVAVTVAGCGIKIGEKNNREVKVAEIKGTSCLKPSLAQLKKFVAGTASDEDLSESLECLQKVLLTFKENIRGKDVNSYTPEEIGTFLTQNFLKDSDFQLTPELMSEVLKFKAMLLGGDTEKVTKEEIIRLTDVFARYKPELQKLNPHMKVITGKWSASGNKTQDQRQFNEAKRALLSFLDHLGRDLALTQRSYDLNDMFGLVEKIAGIAKANESTLSTIRNARGVIIAFKQALIGGDTGLKGQEWVAFTQTLGQAYTQYLRIQYFLKPLKAEQSTEKWQVYEGIAVDVVGLMEELLSRKDGGILRNEEIIGLLASLKPLMPSLDLNVEMVGQLNHIKVMLLGRHNMSAQGWTKADFAALKQKVPVILKNLNVIMANMKHLKINKEGYRKAEIKYEDFQQAEANVQAAVKELSDQIVESYDLDILKATVLNLSRTILKDSLKLPENIEQLFEVVKTAKYTLTGESGSTVSRNGMRLLLNVGIHMYANLVDFSNFVNVFKIEENEFTANLARLLPKFKSSVGLLLRLKPDHNISTQEIVPLIMALQEQGLVKTKLRQASIESAVNALWSHILNPPEKRLAQPRTHLGGFGTTALEQLSVELQVWVMNQMVINRAFTEKETYTKEELLPLLNQMGATELHRMLNAKGLMNFNSSGFLKILTESNGKYTRGDLIKSNLARAISRVLIRSFSTDIGKVNSLYGISLEELQTGFNLVKGLIVDMGLVEEALADGFVPSRFREANLFLSVGNGDSTASMEEVHHLALHIMSGIGRANVLKTVALERCVESRNTENEGLSLLDETCLVNLYYNETAAFADLPKLLEMKQKHTEEEVKTYYLSLLKAAGYVQNEDKKVKLSDAALFPHVAQYLEMIFYTHDSSLDSLLQKEEALAAFPVFKELIVTLTKSFPALVEADMPGVFIFLLKEGKAPRTLAEKLKFAAFVKDHDCTKPEGCHKGWDIQSTRLDLGKIFNFIAEATRPQPAPTATQPTVASSGTEN